MRRLSLLLGALALWALFSVLPLAAPSVPFLADARSPPDAAVPAAAPPLVVQLRIDGAIGPAVAEHVRHGLAHAAQRHAQLVLLQLDTPGGLDSAMRDIIKDILASPLPVVSHVAPSGARAASAGTYIVYASHVAAMAPATTLGAATPVAVGMTPPGAAPPASAASGAAPQDVLAAKRVSDAAAYIRALALLRGRNAEWAERAVRESLSLPASEALAQHVVDLIAPDAPALLRALDGRGVVLASGARVQLATRGAVLEPFEPDWRSRLLAVIGEPSLALLLLAIGFYGLLFEFANPGFLLPGVVGAVCLLLGLFGLQTLPISYAGLALLLLGLLFFVAELFVPSFGVLGLGGAVAFTLGALMLVDSEAPGFGVSRPLVYALALALFACVGLLAWLTARTRRRPVVSGAALLVGRVGEVIEVSADEPSSAGGQAWAELGGERWRVRCERPLRRGERVRVRRVDGLTLEVEGA